MMPRNPLIAMALAGALLLGACSDDAETVDTAATTTTTARTSPSSSTPPSDPTPPVDCVDMATYAWFGSSKEEAIARAEAEGVPWRIGREDDEVFDLTEDHRPGRVTFQIDEGMITFATTEVDVGVAHEGAQDPDDVGYLGLTQAEAEAKADEAGVPWRVVRVGDEVFAVTLDYSEDRRNLEIDGEPPCAFVTVITRG